MENINKHYSNKWQLGIHRIPDVVFNCKSVEFPSLSAQAIPLNSPLGKYHVAGKILDYGTFSFEFIVDENFENYNSILTWMIGASGSVAFENYVNLINDGKYTIQDRPGKHNIYSDGTLLSLTNAGNPNREFSITNLFPVSLGSPRFDQNNDVNVCNAGFSYDYFGILPK